MGDIQYVRDNVNKHRGSRPEQLMAEKLDSWHVEYIRQFPIGKYRADFYLPTLQVILEVFGCYWHKCRDCGYAPTRKMLYKQRRRAKFIQKQGYRLVIVWEHELKGTHVDIFGRLLLE